MKVRFLSQVASKCQGHPMVNTRKKLKVDMESTLLPSSVPQDQLWVSQMGNHQNRRPDRCPDGLEAKANRPVPARAASPDLGEDDMEE